MKSKAELTAIRISNKVDDVYNRCAHVVDEVCDKMVQALEYKITLRESFFNGIIMRDILNVTVDDIIHCIKQEGFCVEERGFEYIISIPCKRTNY